MTSAEPTKTIAAPNNSGEDDDVGVAAAAAAKSKKAPPASKLSDRNLTIRTKNLRLVYNAKAHPKGAQIILSKEECALGTEQRSKVKRCSSEGCANYTVKGGVCSRHGAKVKRCSSEGCANNAQIGGVCMRHGAKKNLCSSEGCTNNSHKGGVCMRHGANRKSHDVSAAFGSEQTRRVHPASEKCS
ncbi:hypothetical protein QTG54_000034 [Skeletonema marinoi]|uniref:WRKY transcription factor 19 n=1 Tax=Skeletonema marinoi TaxID=267567 RepID=A0AAD9DJK7_9STRA|nr:hypothetical protein QTG54_000034 [Skeletonema marinoi]